MRILLADDDRITRIRLNAYLQEWGHEVILAEDGNRAWELFQRESPWLVISDWQMPGMSGVEFVRRIRDAAPPGQYVYAILLTSRSQKTDLVEGMEAGADDFVAKPFDKDELRVRIRAGERLVNLERELAARNQELSGVNERMRSDLRTAARIQNAFLPRPDENFPGIRAAWRYQPCDELAGDTLNVLRLDETHVGFYVADVAGHGVASALLSVMLSRLLSKGTGGEGFLVRHNSAADGPEIVPPAAVARHLNNQFPWNPEVMEYFTLFYGVFEVRSGVLSYVCAGHPRPVLVPADRPAEQLRSDPPALGMFPDAEFAEHQVRLAPGDRLYAFTDGLVESLNPAAEQFGETRILKVAEAHRSRTLPVSVRAIIAGAGSWREGRDPTDDQCVVGIEIVGGR